MFYFMSDLGMQGNEGLMTPLEIIRKPYGKFNMHKTFVKPKRKSQKYVTQI